MRAGACAGRGGARSWRTGAAGGGCRGGDARGYGDFVADARGGLRVAGAAVIVVDAVAGVQVQTEKVWKYANEYTLPRVIVINRLDRERADFNRTLESLQKRLQGRLAPFQVPIGSEAGFTGV